MKYLASILLSLFFCVVVAQKEETVTFKYVQDVDLKLHILFPDSIIEKDKRPAIIFFFGGGWLSGDINHFRPQAEHFRTRGLICVLAEYRVFGRNKTSPFIALSDAKSAMRFLRKNAGFYNIDPDKIIASGGSAGGHLAAALASIKGFDDPQDDLQISTMPVALVLFNPVLDNGPGGYGYDRVKDNYREFSPYYNIVRGLPPTVIFLGTKDNIIPVKTMEQYTSSMRKMGNICELHLYSDQDHGFFNLSKNKNNPYFYETLNEADMFLVKLGYLKDK